jgi:hypothetical protein
VTIEHEPGQCPFCAAAGKFVKFSSVGEVIFLESCDGRVARVELVLRQVRGTARESVGMVECVQISADAARAEISERAAS